MLPDRGAEIDWVDHTDTPTGQSMNAGA